MSIHLNQKTWQDKRIFAMNRMIKRKRLSALDYLDEYEKVINSKAKNKKQYKGENNVGN
tara:strand:- start:790 stop:966 length:177 start_codon:yes stop_codon:yes gene_type:complete